MTSDGFFVGNWKNVFPFAGAQQAPVTIAALPDIPVRYGITSMTGDGGGVTGTIVPGSLTQVSFYENDIHYRGYQFTLDRNYDVHPTDGSTWVFFMQIPEPGAAAALVAVVPALIARRRR